MPIQQLTTRLSRLSPSLHAPPAMPLIQPPPRSQATSAIAATAAASVGVLLAKGSAEPLPPPAANGSTLPAPPPPAPAAKGSPPRPLAAAKGSAAAVPLLLLPPPGAANGSAWKRRLPNRPPKSPKLSSAWRVGVAVRGAWVSDYMACPARAVPARGRSQRGCPMPARHLGPPLLLCPPLTPNPSRVPLGRDEASVTVVL